MEEVEKVANNDSMGVRYLKLMFGLLLAALGRVLTINANLGYAPWDVFQQGLSNIFYIKIGTANIVVGLIIVIIGMLKGQRYGIGTICNMIFVGVFMNIIMDLNIIPVFSNEILGVISIFLGMITLGYGTYFYLKAGFGAGPRDGLMLLLHESTGRSIRFVRNFIEITVLIAGHILGGPVGIGTVILSLGTGYAVQFVFDLLHFDPKTVDHRGLDDEMRFFKKLIKNN